eukprot:s134_g18.t1
MRLLPKSSDVQLTTAGAAAWAPGQLLVIGGAPSMCSAEVYRVQIPEAGLPNAVEDEKIDDLPDKRMGCQAAVLSLPSGGKTYPVTDRRCVVVIGGEKYDEVPEVSRIRQMSAVPVYDTELAKWREDRVVPPLPCPRTAVAVCVGLGRGELPVGPLPCRSAISRLGVLDVPHMEAWSKNGSQKEGRAEE